jgi:hypothetical protein
VALLVGLVLAGLPTASAGPRPSVRATVFATTPSNRLLTFNSAKPQKILSSLLVSGLEPGETLLGIDFRPATGELYGLASMGTADRLYKIDPASGAATAVSATPLDPGLVGTSFGFDFNPVPDRLRLVTDVDQNLRVNPITGAVVDTDPAIPGVQIDGPLAYAAADPNVDQDPNLVAAAYTNPDTDPATGTTNFGIDSNLDVLVTQGTREGVTPPVSPNTGQLFTVGPLGLRASSITAFDIGFQSDAGDQVALAAFGRGGRDRRSDLVQIDLDTGRARRLGPIGGREVVVGLAIAPP